MTAAPQLQTERLLLRQWRDGDLAPFAALNADPVVMEYFPSTLTAEQSALLVAHTTTNFAKRGYGLWAVEVKGGVAFVGFVGLTLVDANYPFGPAVEVGWRLARPNWGNGYATEAARTAVDFGFTTLGLDEIVSFTVPANRRSRAVMERLGMTRDMAGDFDHPHIPEGHPLRPHVLYRLSASANLPSPASGGNDTRIKRATSH